MPADVTFKTAVQIASAFGIVQYYKGTWNAVMRTDNWPISKNNLIKKFYKDFAKFTNIINFDKM